MKKFVVLKDNREIEVKKVADIADLFEKGSIYGLLILDTPLGKISFWYDDEGLYKDTEVNYNASLLGNYNCFVGDIILSKSEQKGGELNDVGFLEEEIEVIIEVIDYLNEEYKDVVLKRPSTEYQVISLDE